MAGFFTTGLFTQTGKQGGIDELREELHQTEDELHQAESDIADNSTAITENATAIAENASAIAQNASAISDNATAITQTIEDLHTNYYTKPEVDGKISSVYKYKGSVATYADLPTNLTEAETGFVYNVETADAEHHINANDNVAWNGHAWDNLGGFVDFSILATKAELAAGITAAEQFATSADAAVLQEAKAFTTSSVADEAQARTAADATKVDKEILSAEGKAIIFNESDGGGAKFEHTDGTESYVGVNNGGQNGLVAQIYADRLVNGKWNGAKLDVKNTGMYYTVGSDNLAARAVPGNELAVKHDVTDAVSAEATARATADATKVDKELTSAAGTSSIFNEVDGGGTMFTRNDGIISYVGVHDGTNGAGNKLYKVVDKATGNPIAADGNMLMGQIYVRDANHAGQDGSISVIDLTKDGFYYKHGANTTVTADNEIATKGDIAAEITALRNEINTLKAELVYKGEILGE